MKILPTLMIIVLSSLAASYQWLSPPSGPQDQYQIRLAQLNKETIKKQWKQFFSARNAQEFWEILQPGSTWLSFGFSHSGIPH